MLGPLCNQTVNLKTHSKPLYYGILKLKYSPSFLKQNTIKITRTGYFYKYTCSDGSIDLCVLQDTYHDWFCIFGDFYSTRTQDAEVTKSLHSYGYNKHNSLFWWKAHTLQRWKIWRNLPMSIVTFCEHWSIEWSHVQYVELHRSKGMASPDHPPWSV